MPPRGSGRSGSRDQRFRAGSYASTDGEVRVVAGEPAAERVDAAAERRRGEVLSRTRPSHRAPAQRAQVERERRLGEPRPRRGRRRPTRARAAVAAAAAAARSSGGRGRVRQRVAVVEERRPERRAIGPVATDDDHATAPRGGGGMVDGDGQVGQALPGVAARVVRVDTSRVRTAREEAADDDDPSTERRRGDLGARLGERRAGHPRSGGQRRDGGQRRAGRHPSQATRRIASATSGGEGSPRPELTISTRVSVAVRDRVRRLRGIRRRQAAPSTDSRRRA